MALKKERLIELGYIASIYEETLTDGSKVFNVRVYDARQDYDVDEYSELHTTDRQQAEKIIEVLNALA